MKNVLFVFSIFIFTHSAFGEDKKCTDDGQCCANWTADGSCAHKYACSECPEEDNDEKKCTDDGKCCAHWTAGGSCAHKYECSECP
ncbi:MAG: hypothetical protein R3A80_05290 [Bdellovibrionota bacterium]